MVTDIRTEGHGGQSFLRLIFSIRVIRVIRSQPIMLPVQPVKVRRW